MTVLTVINKKTGIIMGSGGPSTKTLVESADITRNKGPKRVGPFAVPKAMSSTNSATLATPFGIKGVNYSISSACATAVAGSGLLAGVISISTSKVNKSSSGIIMLAASNGANLSISGLAISRANSAEVSDAN